MYEIIRLKNPSETTSFAPLVPEKLQYYLDEPPHEKKPVNCIIAIGATYQGKPIGIALARCGLHYPEVNIVHLFVLPEHRHKTVGSRLFNKLQEEAAQIGGRYFLMIYKQEDPTTAALEKILTASQWSTRPYMLQCLFNGFTFDIPWVHEEQNYPAGFEEFLWTDLKAEERKKLLKEESQGVFMKHVSPFFNESLIEPINSLGLRYQGNVIGWMITHRTAVDTINYRSLYVERGLQFQQLATKLIFNSIRRHMQARTQWAFLEIPVTVVKNSWIHFVERRIAPYADKVTHLKQAWFNSPSL